MPAGGTNRNKPRGKIDTLKKKLRGSQAAQLYERSQVINLPPQQLIATDTSGTTRTLKTKADALPWTNVRVVTGIGCGIRTART